MRSFRGFTLLEMLVVMAVLGVIASLTLPDLTPVVRRTEMRGSTGDVVAVLERARRDARSSGRCVRVRLDSGALALERADGARCDGNFNGVMRVRPGNGVTFGVESSAGGAIAFVANGRMLGDGDTEVEDDGARVVISSAAFPNQFALVGVTSAGLVCTRLMGAVPAFDPVRVCVEEGAFFGTLDSEDGEVELGDGDGLGGGAGGGGADAVVNVAELAGAPPPPPPPPPADPEELEDGELPPVEQAPPPPEEPIAEESPPPPPEEAPPAPPPEEPVAEESPPAPAEEPPPPTEEPPPSEEPPEQGKEVPAEADSSGSDKGVFENIEGGAGANLEANSGSGFEA